MRSALLLAAALLPAGMLRAQETAGPPGPQVETPARDPDFRVTTRAFGLERAVEMLQWQAREGGYERIWSPVPIDSRGFAPGHANPAAWPLPGRRWLATATLEGKPLDAAAILALGEWREFRPSFNRLPPNLAATFQPEGDGLGSADDPLAPRVGDLRVRWRELVLPPLQGAVELRAGVWRLKSQVADPQPLPAAARSSERGRHAWRPLLLGTLGGLLAMGVVLVLVRRRRGR
jgi:hypothetical protein